jgi:glutamyl/glutaminyl-tRNA synthetase
VELKEGEATAGVPAHVLVPKKGTAEETKEVLAHLAALADAAPSEAYDSVESVKEIFWAYAEEKGKAAVLWPLRVALSGLEKSPDPFTIAYVVGKEETVARVRSARGE